MPAHDLNRTTTSQHPTSETTSNTPTAFASYVSSRWPPVSASTVANVVTPAELPLELDSGKEGKVLCM